MLNQVSVEALHSATYVKNYLDSVENLPDDVQRHLSRIREIDVQYRGLYIEKKTFHNHDNNFTILLLIQVIFVTSTTTMINGQIAQQMN